MPNKNVAASNPESLQEVAGLWYSTLGALLMNTLKFNNAGNFQSDLPTRNFESEFHLPQSCTDKSNTSATGKIGSGNASGEHCEIPNVSHPKRHKRRERTVAATNQFGSSRSPLNRNHLWSTF